MTIDTKENLGPMKLIFNYNNVFYSFFYDDLSGCIHRSREYALNYVYSGEMILDNGSEKIHVRKGECVFIPRDHHFMCDLSIEEIAHYTGRSLATFKRDFKKISDLTPEKWLIKKRLDKAYELMKTGKKKVVEVYAEVGFRNPSHFSTAFKKEFGIAPTAVMN